MTREPSPSLTIAVDELLAWWDAPNSQRVPLDPIIAKIRAARSAPAPQDSTDGVQQRDELREENARLRLEIGLLESREPIAKLEGDRKQHWPPFAIWATLMRCMYGAQVSRDEKLAATAWLAVRC